MWKAPSRDSGVSPVRSREAERPNRSDPAPRWHGPASRSCVAVDQELWRAVDLAAGSDPGRPIVPHVGAVPTRLALERAGHLEGGLLEGAIGAALGDADPHGHTATVESWRQGLRKQAGHGVRPGPEEQELEEDVFVARRKGRVEWAVEGDAPALVRGEARQG